MSLALSVASLALSCGGAPPAARLPAPPPPPAQPTAASEDAAAVPISTKDPAWGSRHALVSVVMFGDIQCPYTGKILKTVHTLEEKYGPTDLRIVWKDEPLAFHPQARPAAEAAESVFLLGQADAFWKFWEQALAHQSDSSTASYEAWAEAAGVDVASFRASMERHAAGAIVDADHALAERLHVGGTPTFFVNGVMVVGAQPATKFVALIDAQLAAARAKLAAGTAPDALYTELAGANWKPPVDEPDDGEKEDTKTVWSVAVGSAPVRGKADALVTIVEFSDFQCPFCKSSEPTLRQIVATYGEKVRVVWKDDPLPFHALALPLAELTREARAEKGDAGFWAAARRAVRPPQEVGGR